MTNGLCRAARGAALAMAAAILGSGLAGCAIVDQFSGRAIEYNLQAEQANDQQLLLNVVRASQRRPLQFTGLQSITGTASASAGTTWTFPFGEATHRPKGAVSPDSFVFTNSMSGGPTFTVPVLDTQEFYQGILNPISLQIFDFYVEQNYPKELLFDLLVSQASVAWTEGGTRHEKIYRNTPSSDEELAQFHTLIEYLLAMGLTTERIETTTDFGPPIEAARLTPSSSADMAQVLDSYAQLSTAGIELAQQGKDKTYHLEKKKSGYRLCFTKGDSSAANEVTGLDENLFCGQFRKTQKNSNQGVEINGNSELSGLSPLFERLGVNRMDGSGAPRAALVSLNISIRSTESIIYYLGEVVRRQLFPELEIGAPPRIIQTKTHVPAGYIPQSDCNAENGGGATYGKTDLQLLRHISANATPVPGPAPAAGSSAAADNAPVYYCENLLYVAKGFSLSGAFISVDYDGGSYALSNDIKLAGRSYQVLELVKQLLALNTSAKQLPAANVLSIITTP
ncbi:MAG TPA: hypothetical protein VFC38_09945 [Stellaceae bacterium]|nr:hypothetical protein [Stellaceae bacterium]